MGYQHSICRNVTQTKGCTLMMEKVNNMLTNYIFIALVILCHLHILEKVIQHRVYCTEKNVFLLPRHMKKYSFLKYTAVHSHSTAGG